MKAYPVVDLATDMVHGPLVCNAGHDEMDVFHDHADTLLLFLLLLVLIAGTVLLVKLRGNGNLYRFYFRGRFSGRLFLNCYDLGGRRLFLAELDFVDFVCVEDDCLEGEVEQPA